MTFVVDRGSHKARLRADFRSPVSEQRTSASCIPYFIETHLQASGKRSSSFIVDPKVLTYYYTYHLLVAGNGSVSTLDVKCAPSSSVV